MFVKEILFFCIIMSSNFLTACKKTTCKNHILVKKPSESCVSKESFARRAGFKVGYVQTVVLKGGKQLHMRTRSLRPLLFEIPNFLSGNECEHIINLAKKKGLEESKTLSDDLTHEQNAKPAFMDLQIARYRRVGKWFGNQLSSVEEMTSFIYRADGIYPRRKDSERIFQIFDGNGDNTISENELFLASDKRLMERLFKILSEFKYNPLYRSRYSQQTWLPYRKEEDTVLVDLKERILKVTKLPKVIVENSEDLQVVQYSVDGHFHGHYDSTEDEVGKKLPCCKTPHDQNDCHLCRYITILFFLNSVALGGETAFPVADARRVYRNQTNNLSLHCHHSNMVFNPKRGTALMWYNHLLDPISGLLGQLDVYSLHGGCDVREGHKWIANSWINLPKP